MASLYYNLFVFPLVAEFTLMEITRIQFPATHDEGHYWFAHCVSIHEESSNNFKRTDISDMISIANKFKLKSGTDSWADATVALNDFYGKGKRSFVWRSVILAQTVSDDVATLVVTHKLPTSWFFENDYFSGHGQTKDFKLSPEAALKCLEWVGDAKDDNSLRNLNKGSFMSEYCKPALAISKWITQLGRDYGGLCKNPAVQRCFVFLWLGRLRPQVHLWGGRRGGGWGASNF